MNRVLGGELLRPCFTAAPEERRGLSAKLYTRECQTEVESFSGLHNVVLVGKNTLPEFMSENSLFLSIHLFPSPHSSRPPSRLVQLGSSLKSLLMTSLSQGESGNDLYPYARGLGSHSRLHRGCISAAASSKSLPLWRRAPLGSPAAKRGRLHPLRCKPPPQKKQDAIPVKGNAAVGGCMLLRGIACLQQVIQYLSVASRSIGEWNLLEQEARRETPRRQRRSMCPAVVLLHDVLVSFKE